MGSHPHPLFTACPRDADSRDPPSEPTSSPKRQTCLSCCGLALPSGSLTKLRSNKSRREASVFGPCLRSALLLGLQSPLRAGAASQTLTLKITESCSLLTPPHPASQKSDLQSSPFPLHVVLRLYAHLYAQIASALDPIPNASSSDCCSRLPSSSIPPLTNLSTLPARYS